MGERKSVDSILKNQFGYKNEFGLLLAQAHLRILAEQSGRIPNSSNKDVQGILFSLSQGAWVKMGVITWQDLINKTFPPTKKVIQNVEHSEQEKIEMQLREIDLLVKFIFDKDKTKKSNSTLSYLNL
ncbi:MAG: hypothetical protein ACFFCQ_16930 [Promethearchaeota archaeon]